jgi:ADP-heptose:LPS heptosyltransferase
MPSTVGGAAPWIQGSLQAVAPDLYAEVVRRLVADHSWQVVLTGSEHERDLASEIARWAAVPLHDQADALDLAELVALIASARPHHEQHRPVAHRGGRGDAGRLPLRPDEPAPYALTNPQHTPWQVPSRVLSQDVPCRWCFRSVCPEGHHACLRGVPPKAVVSAALELAARR